MISLSFEDAIVLKRHLDRLIMQREYFKFAEQEKSKPNWNLITYNLLKSTMKLLQNRFTQTLSIQFQAFGENIIR